MNLSVSDLLPFLDCPYAGTTRLREQAWAGSSGALRVGTAVHQHMEWVLHGRPTPPPLLALHSAEEQAQYEHCIAGVASWSPPWPVLSVEEPLQLEVRPDLWIQGRLDARVEDKGQWSLQWKTLGRGVDVGKSLEKIRMSPHEITYHMLVKQVLGIDLKGTIVGTFKKHLTKAEQAQGVPIFQLWQLHRPTDEAQAAWEEDIFPAFDDLASALRGWPRPRRDWTKCLGKFDNFKCPLYDHCHLGLPISALGLVTLEDRYAPEADI